MWEVGGAVRKGKAISRDLDLTSIRRADLLSHTTPTHLESLSRIGVECAVERAFHWQGSPPVQPKQRQRAKTTAPFLEEFSSTRQGGPWLRINIDIHRVLYPISSQQDGHHTVHV